MSVQILPVVDTTLKVAKLIWLQSVQELNVSPDLQSDPDCTKLLKQPFTTTFLHNVLKMNWQPAIMLPTKEWIVAT